MSRKKLVKIAALFASLVVLAALGEALPFKSQINQGNDYYKKGEYKKAAGKYGEVLQKKKEPLALFNLGDAIYKEGNFSESEKIFSVLTKEAVNNRLREAVLYNLGNAQFRQENYQGAINSYEEALKIDEKDQEAKYNLELARKMLNNPKKQAQKKQEENNKNKGKDKQKSKGEDEKQGKNKQQNKSGLKKEDAERILQGIKDDEKHKAKTVRGKGGNNGPDW